MGLSYHQLIYCTRKFSRSKVRTHKQLISRSLKNYPPETYKKALGKVYFPDYEKFSDENKAYENVIQKLISVIDKLALNELKLNELKVIHRNGLMVKF